MQTTIKAVLSHKPRHVWSVAPSTSAHDAVHLMVDKRIEALLVLAQDKLVGILTERDCARRIWLLGKNPGALRVEEVMTSPVVFVTGGHSVGDCMKIMSERGFTHLPVVEGERVVGLVSVEDLVRTVVDHQDRMISHLEGYITGTYHR